MESKKCMPRYGLEDVDMDEEAAEVHISDTINYIATVRSVRSEIPWSFY